MTKKINRELTEVEIREISEECEARDNRPCTPPEEWRAIAEGDGWTLCKLDTLPDMYALLSAGEPLILDREEVVEQLGDEHAIAAGCGPIRGTDGGDYELVAHIYDDGCGDTSINLYVGRAADDGHHDLIASDNASLWVVGSEDDAEANRAQWELITERIGEIDFAVISAIDADLAEWLEAS